MTYYSGLSTDSITSSTDKAGVFPSFYDTTTFLASSFPSPYSDTVYPASSPSSPPSENFFLDSYPPSPPSDTLPRIPPLNPLPLKALSRYLPDCLNFNALVFLAFAFVISGIELEQCCLHFSFSYLEVIFWSSSFDSTALMGREHFPRVAQRS